MENLALVRDFVNTAELELGQDSLDSVAALRRWLAGHGLAASGARVTADDLREAVAIREALRVLLLANNEVDGDVTAAEAVLDRAARSEGVALRFRDGARLEPVATGAAGGLGRLLAVVAGAMAEGSWSRLKACRSRSCRWAFVDEARNHSRAWCSMQVCGNREKARLYRERHAGGR